MIKENYQYPLDYQWSQKEMITVITFFNSVEKAYETGIPVDEIKKNYQEFKKVVPSIGEEKRLGKAFEEESGYSCYRVVQKMKKENKKILKMEEK